MRRLGVFSLGFLWQPKLRKALLNAGWHVQAGHNNADAIGVWGRRGVAQRGAAMARWTGKPLITMEDGFLRSIEPGIKTPVISLIVDDCGIYYDSTRPSRLETLIAMGGGDVVRARRAIETLRKVRLSKYNHAPDMTDPLKGHVLVIDQTLGDASVRWGGATDQSFLRMLQAAAAEHPGEQIVVKRHPETVSGSKQGHLRPERCGDALIVADAVNPWDLIEGAKAVYTVSSQLGFEALMAGKPVRCFGSPFYSGWGATEDENPVERREQIRTTEEIFAAAYLDYPVYFDPWREEVSDFETAVGALATLRSAYRRNSQPSVCSGVRLWKRKYVSAFLDGPGGPVRYDDDIERAAVIAKNCGARHVVWASKSDAEDVIRLEDGFLRSSGLGAALTPPLSVSMDDTGIYFDPGRPSRLERLIEDAPTDQVSLGRAAALRRRLVDLGLSKYNLKGQSLQIDAEGRKILVVGQVEDDASIIKGAGAIVSNLQLVESTRAAAPDACLIYKPHPDVEAGLREGAVDPQKLAQLVDYIADHVDITEALDAVGEVWTITSLTGFEALLRGKKVTTFGAPFYAGWGLTEDRGEVPDRRRARPSLDSFVHAVLIDYPMYRDPVSGLPCEVEVVLERLAVGAGLAGAAGKVLSKLQGAAASYAWLWR